MAKMKSKVIKTRMSAVVDHSTMGLTLGTEMEISEETHSSLRKAFKRAVARGITKYNVEFILISGDALSGNATFLLRYVTKNKKENSIQYEFKKQGSNYFINVSGNPTSLAAGGNDVPILIKGSEHGEYNTATITFKYLNRLMYAILDPILGEYNFKWSGKDKKKLVEGDINIQSYQVAWYSGDLADQRNNTLTFIRSMYGGLNATKNIVENVGKGLALNTRIWDNHDGNLTIEAKSGDKNRAFSLTLYAKDEDPSYKDDGDNNDRLRQLIRWDCTLNNAFLINNKIKKIKELEAKYIEVCDEFGYDIGFIKFISEKVYNRLKLPYFLGLHRDSFLALIEMAESITSKNERIVLDHWLAFNTPFEKDIDAANHFGIKRERYNEAKNTILKRGLDIDISRSTHEAILDNRARATLTAQERSENYKNKKGSKSNEAISWNETINRDTENAKKFKTILGDTGGVLKIRKFKPIKVTPDSFWVFKSPPLISSNANKQNNSSFTEAAE